MLLLVGQHDDPCVHATRALLEQQGLDVVHAAESDLRRSIPLAWRACDLYDTGWLDVGATRVPLDALDGVLLRGRALPPPGELPQEDRWYVASELAATRLALFDALPCRVVNRPTAALPRRLVLGTPEAARRLDASGLAPPRVLVTWRAHEAETFLHRCGGVALLADPWGDAPWQPVAGAEGARLVRERIAEHPVTLQELPAGRWLRVFVAGRAAVAAAAPLSAALGEAGRAGLRRATLPDEIRRRCRMLARGLGLDFAQLDLVDGRDGTWHLLDVTGHPTLDGCTPAVRTRVTGALAALLARGVRTRREPGTESAPSEAVRP